MLEDKPARKRRKTLWGVGPNDTESCDDCCYTCEGGETEEIDLVE